MALTIRFIPSTRNTFTGPEWLMPGELEIRGRNGRVLYRAPAVRETFQRARQLADRRQYERLVELLSARPRRQRPAR